MDPNLVVESVWDYPRPPRLEAVADGVRVVHRGVVVAVSARALRVLETSHPPVFICPPRMYGRTCCGLRRGGRVFANGRALRATGTCWCRGRTR